MSYGGPYQPANSYAQSFIGHPTDPNIGLPPGWIARWDQNSQHWYYVDTSTGRSVWERPIMQQVYAPPPPPQQQPVPPQAGYYAAGGAAASYGASGSGAGGYDDHFDDKGYHKNWSSHQATYTEPKYPKPTSSPKPPKKNSNWGKYAAVGVGALGLGVVGGAVLAHEGSEIENWAGNKVDSVEQGFDGFKDGLENAPENAAGWVGNEVGEAEGKYDDFKDDVENIPENVAGWTGEQVGKAEAFGDDVGDAYDQGRDEGRYGSDGNPDSGSSSSSDDGGDDGYDDGGDYDE